MNKKQIVGALLAVTLAGGTGVLAGCGDQDSNDAQPNASVSSPATPSSPANPSSPATPVVDQTPKSLEDIVLSPGAAGPVKVGMSKAEADALGLFKVGRGEKPEGCDADALSWIAPFDEALDVQTLENGEIASIGVSEPGPKTAAGLGVDSTLAEVLAAYPGSKAVSAGYGQTGVLVHDKEIGAWIGFLFDAPLKKVTDTTMVTFIELTEGEKPSVMRDGC